MHDDAQHGESRAAMLDLKSLSRLAVPLLPKPGILKLALKSWRVDKCYKERVYGALDKKRGLSAPSLIFFHRFRNTLIGHRNI